MIDLWDIKPHQVSRDLRGYSVFFYGEPKSGKTSTAARFPKALLLAFEKGFNTLAGVMANPINSWGEFKKVLKQLKDERAKEMYSTIIVDTADIAYDYCTKYILNNYKKSDGSVGVDKVSDIPYGQGYGLIAKEFDDCLRNIVQMDYGLVLISHSTDKVFTDESGNEYNKIVPTLDKRATNIVGRMADIIAYSREVEDQEGNSSVKLFMRGTPRFMAGSRFKYTPDYIDFNYDNLVNAIAEAIDKQAAEDGKDLYTDSKVNLYQETGEKLDFDELINEFNTLVNNLVEKESEEKFQEYWQPRIVQITDKYLGRGQKVSQCSREQVDALSLIIDDLKEIIK